MIIDPENKVNKLCVQGMEAEGEGKREQAGELFLQAWEIAETNTEKFIAAHYVARHQKSVADKLSWDKKALELALLIDDAAIAGSYPSLYLNIGKCYEDLDDFEQALSNYNLAASHTDKLNDDGYGKMIKGGIESGIKRVTGK